MAKRILVIGCGASGLPAMKCCVDEGLEPVCLERTDEMGGLWNYKEQVRDDQACVMKSTIINTSKEMMVFSDYPMPENLPNFLHNTQGVPVLAFKCFFGPCFPYQYRLQGPGKWHGAREAIFSAMDRVRKPFQNRPLPPRASGYRMWFWESVLWCWRSLSETVTN